MYVIEQFVGGEWSFVHTTPANHREYAAYLTSQALGVPCRAVWEEEPKPRKRLTIVYLGRDLKDRSTLDIRLPGVEVRHRHDWWRRSPKTGQPESMPLDQFLDDRSDAYLFVVGKKAWHCDQYARFYNGYSVDEVMSRLVHAGRKVFRLIPDWVRKGNLHPVPREESRPAYGGPGTWYVLAGTFSSCKLGEHRVQRFEEKTWTVEQLSELPCRFGTGLYWNLTDIVEQDVSSSVTFDPNLDNPAEDLAAMLMMEITDDLDPEGYERFLLNAKHRVWEDCLSRHRDVESAAEEWLRHTMRLHHRWYTAATLRLLGEKFLEDTCGFQFPCEIDGTTPSGDPLRFRMIRDDQWRHLYKEGYIAGEYKQQVRQYIERVIGWGEPADDPNLSLGSTGVPEHNAAFTKTASGYYDRRGFVNTGAEDSTDRSGKPIPYHWRDLSAYLSRPDAAERLEPEPGRVQAKPWEDPEEATDEEYEWVASIEADQDVFNRFVRTSHVGWEPDGRSREFRHLPTWEDRCRRAGEKAAAFEAAAELEEELRRLHDLVARRQFDAIDQHLFDRGLGGFDLWKGVETLMARLWRETPAAAREVLAAWPELSDEDVSKGRLAEPWMREVQRVGSKIRRSLRDWGITAAVAREELTRQLLAESELENPLGLLALTAVEPDDDRLGIHAWTEEIRDWEEAEERRREVARRSESRPLVCR